MRGIRGFDKRKETFFDLRNRADIVCLQETHSTIECENEWSQQWGKGQVIFSHGASNSRGILLCINDRLDIAIKQKRIDDEGRYIIIECEIEKENFVIIGIYAPNDDNPDFFRKILKESENLNGYRIVLGDFNLVLDAELDRTNARNNNPLATAYTKEYLENNNLVDIWRVRNPKRKHYSWRRNKPAVIASRLDLVIVDQAIAPWFKTIGMRKGYRTDHLTVEGEIIVRGKARGKGLWRLNVRHLSNPAFIRMINEKIDVH